jgi:hypothetical protein
VETCFDLAGRTSLVVAGADAAAAKAIAAQMDPFRALQSAPQTEAIVRLERDAAPAELGEIQRAAGDDLVTALAADGLRIVVGEHSCSVPDPLEDAPAVFRFDPGFPLGEIVRPFVKPALQLTLPATGAVAVHSTAITRHDGAVLVAGWSESGKTEVGLGLIETGGAFLSDKWSVLGADGHVSAFPMPVGVRRWVLPYLPRLRGALPARYRAQLAAAGAARAASAPLSGRDGLPSRLVDRAVALGERAGLTPSEVRRAYEQQDDPARRAPLRLVVLLTTVAHDTVAAAEADPAWAAARLAASAAYERRGWYALEARAPYLAGSGLRSSPGQAAARERVILEPVLAGVPVIEVKAPFPADPRRIVEQLTPWL